MHVCCRHGHIKGAYEKVIKQYNQPKKHDGVLGWLGLRTQNIAVRKTQNRNELFPLHSQPKFKNFDRWRS